MSDRWRNSGAEGIESMDRFTIDGRPVTLEDSADCRELRAALERLLLVMLPIWNQGIDDNYLRREGYAAMQAARAALKAGAGER